MLLNIHKLTPTYFVKELFNACIFFFNFEIAKRIGKGRRRSAEMHN